MANFSQDVFKRRVRDVLPQGQEAVGDSVPSGLHCDGAHLPAKVIPLLEISDDLEFVSEAYRRILGRAPDETGKQGYLRALMKGLPRRKLLVLLAGSEEARRQGPRSCFDYNSYGEPARSGRHVSLSWISESVHCLRNAFSRLRAGRELARSIDARADQLSQKLDSSLWTLSSKLDAYVANLLVSLQGSQQSSISRAEKIERSIQDLTCCIDSFQQTTKTSIRLQQEMASRIETAAFRAEGLLNQGTSSIAGMHQKLVLLKELLESQETLSRTLLSVLSQSVKENQEFNRNLATELGELNERQGMLKQWVSEQALDLENKFDVAFDYWASRGATVSTCELNGFIIGVPIDDWRMAAYHRFRGVMEPGLVCLFRRLIKPGMTVVDIGANVGVLTLEAARLVGPSGRVFCFEPTPRTFEILKGNIQVNGYLESGIVVARQIAILDEEGAATLYLYRGNCGHNSLYKDEKVHESIEVKTERLDYALASVNKVDIIKIDAEGAECRILRGAQELLSQNKDIRVIVEFAPVHLQRAGIEPSKFLEEIEALDMRIYRVDETTGEAVTITKTEILEVESVNLLLEATQRA